MGFKKGSSGNPNGRPKGASSERTLLWQELGDYFVNQGAEKAIRIMKGMDDDKFMDVYAKMIEYFKPKQARALTDGIKEQEEETESVVQLSNGRTLRL